MIDPELVEQQTRRWVSEVVVGYNFCPFARREVVSERVRYRTILESDMESALLAMMHECRLLDDDSDVETTLVILPSGWSDFEDYLDLLELANSLMKQSGYEGIYQLASFHPDYCFDGSDSDDAANYTNRSPYPTLHLIREASIEKVLASVEHPEDIPERNVRLAREKGACYMKHLLEMIMLAGK